MMFRKIEKKDLSIDTAMNETKQGFENPPAGEIANTH